MAASAAAVACLTTTINASRAAQEDRKPSDRVPLTSCTAPVAGRPHQPDEGEITLADIHTQRYESVGPYLDGLLRDLEGVSLSDLTDLDASAPTSAAISFIQTVLSANLKFDQAAGINNRRTLANDELQTRINAAKNESDSALLSQWLQQRDLLTSQLISSTNEANQLEQLAIAKTITPEQQVQLDQLKSRKAAAAAGLDTAKAQIDALSAPKQTPLSLTSVTADAPKTGDLASLKDLLAALPGDAKSKLIAALASPSYPAVKRLDDFVTLLHDRLAREVSVLEDDVLRGPDSLTFLVQFDVGLLPTSDAKDRVGRVTFELPDCPDCRIYALYPGASSSYNTVRYDATSRTTGIGVLASGLSAALNLHFDHKKDTAASALLQSLYVAGFNDSSTAFKRFGWLYGAAPGQHVIDTGTRSTYAVISMPRSKVQKYQAALEQKSDSSYLDDACLKLTMKADWPDLKDPEDPKAKARELLVRLPGTGGITEPLPRLVRDEPYRLHVRSLEYNPLYLDAKALGETPSPAAAAKDCQPNDCASIVIELDRAIHPELVVTVRGQLLRRIRDWRGRATALLPPAQGPSDPGAKSRLQNAETRGLLELDKLAPNTWYPLDERRLLLTVSRSLAGDDEFPVIQIIDPTKRTVVIPHDLDQGSTEIITNGFHLVHRDDEQVRKYVASMRPDGKAAEDKKTNENKSEEAKSGAEGTDVPARIGPYSPSTFLPLFNPHARPVVIHATLGETGRQLIIGFERNLPVTAKPQENLHWEAARTQVVIEDEKLDFAWSLSCAPQGPIELICDLPMSQLLTAYGRVAKDCAGDKCQTLEIPKSVKISEKEALLVSTLQVWVSQYDPDNDSENSFYTPSPDRLPLVPLAKPTGEPGSRVYDWRFVEATATGAIFESCGFYPTALGGKELVPLGERFNSLSSNVTVESVDKTNCLRVMLPAKFLERSSVVLADAGKLLSSPVRVETSPAKPLLEMVSAKPVVIAEKTKKVPAWQVTWKLKYSACGDSVAGEELRDGITAEIKCDEKRKAASELVLTIPRASLASLPQRLSIKRGDSKVAESAELKPIILPEAITLTSLGDGQFMLQGNNVDELQRVTVKKGDFAKTFKVAGGRSGKLLSTTAVVPGAAKAPTKVALAPGTYAVSGLVSDLGSGEIPVNLTTADGKTLLTLTIPEPEKKPKSDAEEKPKTECAPFVICCAGCPPAPAASAAATPPKVIKK
jgi:hypothetical protein